MAFSRYNVDTRLGAGSQLGTARASALIRAGIKDGTLPLSTEIVTSGADRLDSLAGAFYGEGRYWWIIAAASGIGWGMQIPMGTIIKVPDLRYVERLLG